MKDFSSLKSLPHYPVMLREVIEICKPEKGGYFIDCTFGAGGYSNSILSFPKTKVTAIDRDKSVEKFAKETKKLYKERFSFHNKKFSELDKLIDSNNKPDFIIFDLGLSSLQLSSLERGFSFSSKNKLDMRMGLNSISADSVLNSFEQKTLRRIFKILGDEKESQKISKNIVSQREKEPIKTVPQLVEIIKKSKKKNFKKKINPCTKTFQAIRIFVNKENSELIDGLIFASKILKKGGKLIVISFHSIEDRIVKYFFSNYCKNKSKSSRYLPDKNEIAKSLFENYKNKRIKPKSDEINENYRSRSAILRFVTRSNDDFFYPKNFKDRFSKYLELEKKNV